MDCRVDALDIDSMIAGAAPGSGGWPSRFWAAVCTTAGGSRRLHFTIHVHHVSGRRKCVIDFGLPVLALCQATHPAMEHAGPAESGNAETNHNVPDPESFVRDPRPCTVASTWSFSVPGHRAQVM